MNEIVNKFSLAGEKFMPDIHLKQLGFTNSACGPFTKIKERIQKFKGTVETKYIYKNEHDKACFQHDMAHGDFKDLARRTVSDKILRDKVDIDIDNNKKIDKKILVKILNTVDIKEGLLLWFTHFLIKSLQAAVLICMEIMSILWT